MRWTLALAVAVALSAIACASGPPLDDPGRRTRAQRADMAIAGLRSRLRPLDFARPVGNSPSRREYLRHYELDVPGASHRLGRFTVDGVELTAQVFRPPRASSTVVVLHGLFDHVGVCAPLIRSLVGAGHAVAAYDLPGHGLSEGPRVTIDDFGSYARSLETFRELIDGHLPEPVFFVGHSTGCAAALDLLLEGKARYERLVFVAPLIRSEYWGFSTMMYRLASWAMPAETSRAWQDISTDEEYLLFRRWEDPLQHDRFTYRWFGALMRWEERIQHTEPVAADVLVLQGADDAIVQQGPNLAFLEEHVRGTHSVSIEGGRHALLNERAELRALVLAAILDFLAPGAKDP